MILKALFWTLLLVVASGYLAWSIYHALATGQSDFPLRGLRSLTAHRETDTQAFWLAVTLRVGGLGACLYFLWQILHQLVAAFRKD